jgi:hypothetical protein
MLGPPVKAERRPNEHKSSIWSVEEIRILKQYEAAYIGELHIYMKIAAHLPFKTNKQATIGWIAVKSLERRLKQASRELVRMTAIEELPQRAVIPLLLEGSDAAVGNEDVSKCTIPAQHRGS